MNIDGKYPVQVKEKQDVKPVLEVYELKKYLLHQRLHLKIILQIAINISESIRLLHSKSRIHKSVNPSSVFINPGTLKTTIIEPVPFYNNGKIDLSCIEDEKLNKNNYDFVNDFLPYISPEQTGRTSDGLDKRSDLYSFGMILFEMLTGKKAFEEKTAIGLLHSHIAKDPANPSDINSDIPKVLSGIVMKLIEKSPAARYQSASGLKNDLEMCYHSLTSSGNIEFFTIGSSDPVGEFRLIKKFYGREKELEKIQHAYGRVVEGAGGMLAVSGYSGIGKTSLVFEFAKKIRMGYGKFEKSRKNIPFSAVVAALGEIISQILTQDKVQIDFWKQRILETIETNGQLIIDLIPNLKMIIGPQPDLPELDAAEAQNRFNTVFQDFISALATRDYPLVLFLDDIQWIDSATLTLFEALSVKKFPYLLVLSAYRENEVYPHHKLIPVLEKLQKEESAFGQIDLGAVGYKNIKKMISETTGIDNDNTDFLSEIINEKSGGNPYYIKEILTGLYNRQLISPDGSKELDKDQIRNFSITENVAELVSRRMNALLPDRLTILKTASCLGRIFSKNSIATIMDLPQERLNNHLQKLVDDHFLNQINDVLFCFSHDKVQESADGFLDETLKREIHYRAGHYFLEERGKNKSMVSVFDIVKHLNNAVSLIASKKEKTRLSALNLEAGMAAKRRAAYNQAFVFLKKGIDLLPEDKWSVEYGLSLALFLQAGEIGFQTGEPDLSGNYLDEILANAKTVYDKVRVFQIRIINYSLDEQPGRAMETGRQGLKLLGVTMPEKITMKLILKELVEVKIRLIGKSMDQLSNLPGLKDLRQEAVIKLLSDCYGAAVIGRPEYFPFITLKILNITLKYGETASSSYGFITYGAFLCSKFGRYEEGYEFARLGLEIAEKYDDNSLKSRVHMMFGGCAYHWKNHLRDSDYHFSKAYRYATKNSSDLQHAGFAILSKLCYQMYRGKPLERVEENFKNAKESIAALPLERSMFFFNFMKQILLTLKGDGDDLHHIKGPYFDEDNLMSLWEKTNDDMMLGIYYIFKLMLGYLYRDFSESEKWIMLLEEFMKKQMALFAAFKTHYLSSLVLIELYPEATASKKRVFLKRINKCRKKLKKAANVCPENFYNMYSLVEAEFAALKNKNEIAAGLYDKAIQSAGENGFHHFEAIANECAGYFYLKTKRPHFAKLYMIEAKKKYLHWGAKAKAKMLEESFPDFFGEEINEKAGFENHDLVSIIKASQTIAGESEIEPLMDKLMAVIIENAGAGKGFLVAKNDKNEFDVVARIFANPVKETLQLPAPVDAFSDLPKEVIRYADRTRSVVVLSDASQSRTFKAIDYFRKNKVKSLLCLPIKENDSVTGILYLENNRVKGAFTPERVEILKAVSDIIVNARAKKRAETELGIYQEKLRALSSEVLISEEKERRKIAVGLHDHIGQSLTLSRMKLGLLKKQGVKEMASKVDEVIDLISQTISDTRNLTFELSPPDLYELGLEAAIDALSEKMLEPHGITTNFHDDMKEKSLSESTNILVFQAVREILFNIIKHADAKKVDIFITKENDNLKIIIKDDGKGFDPDKKTAGTNPKNSFGLFSVRERMNYHRGGMTIESAPGKGTRVELLSPLS